MKWGETCNWNNFKNVECKWSSGKKPKGKMWIQNITVFKQSCKTS